MPQSRPVVLIGDANVDVVLEIPELPAPGEDALAESQRIGVGGSAANTAIVLSRLGVSVELICCLGVDPWSQISLADLTAEGVGLKGIQRNSEHPTSINVVTVTPDFERTMFAHRGSSAQLDADLLDVELIKSARLLYISGYGLLADPQRAAVRKAIDLAVAADIPCVLDVPVPATEQASAELREVLVKIDLLVIGLSEAESLFDVAGEATSLEALFAAGARRVALKLGERGAVLAAGADQLRAAGLSVIARDSTGAGDSFTAGAIYGLIREWGWQKTIEFANKCGALAVQKAGAGRNLPERDELRVRCEPD